MKTKINAGRDLSAKLKTSLFSHEGSYKSIQVFKNPFLEKFTHVEPIVPLLIWGPVVGWLIWRSFAVHELPFREVMGLGLIGVFSWTLAEYILHRFVFHYKFESPLGQRLHFLIHGLHHDDPLDATRLVMPPVASVILSIPFYFGLR